MFAYGVPFVLLFSCFVHVHVKNISDMEIALACYEHRKLHDVKAERPVIVLLSNMSRHLYSRSYCSRDLRSDTAFADIISQFLHVHSRSNSNMESTRATVTK